MNHYVVTLNVHGIGARTRSLEPGEGDVWISLRQFEEVLDRVSGRDDVRLTFDDGNVSDVEIALPLLLERGLEAEFFVCPGLFGQPGRLAEDGVRELLKSGMSIGSHGWEHTDWRRVTPAQVLREIQDSRDVLRELSGGDIPHVSVPFGSYDRHVLRELRHFGVSRVYTSDGGRARRDSWLQARTSLRSDLDQAWLDRILDPHPPLRHRVRGLAARAVKRSRGERRPGGRNVTPERAHAQSPVPPATPPRIGIVIITYNSSDVLPDCLASLSSGAQGVELTDVVVVDNASTDDCVRIATEFDDVPVRVVEFGVNSGYAAGANAGVKNLDLDRLDGVLVLNPDCRLRPGSIAKLAAAFDTPGRGIVAPKLINPDGSLQPSLRHEPAISRSLAESLLGSIAGRLGIGELVAGADAYAVGGPWSWATGAAMLLSTSMIKEIGPWDESFLLYSEETEYSLRAADYAWQTWYEPESVIEHVGGVGHMQPQLAALLASNRVRLYRLRHGALPGALFRLVELQGAAIRAAMGRPQARAAAAVLLRPSTRIRELPGSA